MSIDRPMNEYEGALFTAVMTLIGTVVDLGVDRKALAAEFRENAECAKLDGHESGAAVSELFAQIAEDDLSDIAVLRKRPPFTIIKGGKDEDPA